MTVPDYQGNSRKLKEIKDLPEKNVEKVVITDVIVQKKGIGRKFKDIFVEADFKTVSKYVVAGVLIPALRDMLVDAIKKGTDRMVYGEAAIHRRNFGQGPRITYNNPINRGYHESPLRESTIRYAPPTSPEPRNSRHERNDFIISSREEAELVLERMNDILDTYKVASLADLNDLVGLPTTHVDNKWGWTNLNNVQILQIREGYLIDFPPLEPIQ